MHDTFPRLFAHMAWADGQILSILDAADPRMDESIVLFAHLVAAEHIWLSRIRSIDLGSFGPWTALSLPEAARLASGNASGWTALVDGPLEMERIVSYRTTKGDPMSTALGDILLHVALHGSYHRGQIATRLRRLEIAVPPTDFVVFSRLFPPEP